jgi:RsiW-degrading membrane proteinase PrsW (M82 family)
LLFTFPISALVFNSATCISVMDDVTQVAVVSFASSAMLLRWSNAAGRVPMRTITVVIIVTPVFVLLVIDSICYYCRIQHHLESLDVRVDLFVIFGEMGVTRSTNILEAKALWAGVR